MSLLPKEISFFQGSVFHARLAPKKHQFSYPVFFSLLPIKDDIKSPFSLFSLNRWNLFSFYSKDYLKGETGSLKTELFKFLESQSIDWRPDEIWLHTSPRILGYAFNPVSFWYLAKSNQLEKVLVEVNNTFGERHFYWVDKPQEKKILAKEFHVSPFFHILGKYEFGFHVESEKIRVDINYFSEDDQLLLKTYVSGKLNKQARPLNLFFKYGWMTLLVISRIHFQAMKIFCKKIPYVPKPLQRSERLTK